MCAGTANQDGKGNGVWKHIAYTGCQAGFSRSLVKEKNKKDKGAQVLCLIFGRASTRRIKLGDEFSEWIQVEVEQFLAFLIIEVKGILRVVAGKPAAAHFSLFVMYFLEKNKEVLRFFEKKEVNVTKK